MRMLKISFCYVVIRLLTHESREMRGKMIAEKPNQIVTKTSHTTDDATTINSPENRKQISEGVPIFRDLGS